MTGALGVAISQINLTSNIGQLAQSINKLSQNPTDANVNDAIQNLGGTLSALGGAAYSAGAMSGNSYLFGFGLILETYGNLLKEGNKWSAEHPTDSFDPFFKFFDDLNGAGHYIGQNLPTWYDITETISRAFNSAQRLSIRRDPLVLDLDGLETLGPTQSNVLFDHDADGIKTATGWVKPDDGFLVMDRNNNGVIDNGRELFGDATPLYAGGTAADGFAALAQEDTNGDGRVDHLDANWSKLRVWRDLNQDGVSQSNELLTMGNAGIAGFNVARTINSATLANGNQVADLVEDNFHREFTDQITLAEGVAALSEMQGSDKVRDLHKAANGDSYRKCA